MKMKTFEAARRLGVHPSRIFQHIVELDAKLTFADVWPEIDAGWVETVSALGHRDTPVRTGQPAVTTASSSQIPTHRLSEGAVHVLDKLYRQRKWADVAVTFVALQNLTHLAKRDLQDVVAELRRGKFLDHDGSGGGTISLNPARRNEIDMIAQQTRARVQSCGG